MASDLGDQPDSLGTSEVSFNESTSTHSALSSSNPDLARVFVRLVNGTKIVVSVPQNSTVHVLHSRALQRAARLGVRGTLENTILQTTGESPAVVFGEDPLVEVLDLTEDGTFSLGPLETIAIPVVVANEDTPTQGSDRRISPSHPESSTRQAPHSISHQKQSKVYVRWITLEDALNYPRLRKIPVDKAPISCDITVSEFHRIAVERLCGSSRKGSCTNPRKLNLFLRECSLQAENNVATLRDLGLMGKHEPLDVFVEFTGPECPESLSELSPSTEPGNIWCFDSTKRGISTFVISMQMLLKEIGRGNCSLYNVLEVLWELTHFPPLLLAFMSVHETGIDRVTPAGPLMLIASAFHALGTRMVPAATCQSTDTNLEASRQIVCWIYSMHSQASLSSGSSKSLVHRAQIKAASNGSQMMPTFLPFRIVNISDSGSSKKAFLVSVETGDSALCQRLGNALHRNPSSPWDFYFQAIDNWDTLWNHKIMPLLNPNEFDSLIETTNSIQAFRMVGPLQIGACLAAELPVITLSATGYVSTYDHEDLECSERAFNTWNPIERKQKLPDNPGQFLSQKLDPIMAERKKMSNWELDAWPEWTKTADFGAPDESIVICVDTSSSMDIQMPTGWIPDQDSLGRNPSRLTEVKEFFKNVALRISALNLSTHLGLVTFSNCNKVLIKQPLTALHLNFNHQLDNVNALGSTAIFDAVGKACEMLREAKRQHPQTKCRIILLTDGVDNDSTSLPSVISSDLYANNIVLDAVVIGSSQTTELFKIAKNTGGYAFLPKTQQAFFQIFLLETFVDIRTRPEISRTSWYDWLTFLPKPADMADPYDFPPCRPHPNLDDYFFSLGDAERFMDRLSSRSSRSSASVYTASTRLSVATTMTVGAGGSSRILLSEIKAMIDNPHDYMDVYVSQSNMGFWKVVMQGPPDSPYAKGTFLLYIEIGPEFPRRPPSARFITPMLHPNITKHGRVCHPIFDREWTPATRVYQVLQHLYGILMSLEARDAVDPLSALRFWSNEGEGNREVENYINRFATRSRSLYRLDIIRDDVSSLSSSSVISSSASTASGSTVTSPSPPSFRSHAQSLRQAQGQGQNPSSSSQSSPSAPSESGASLRSVSTTSSLFRHLSSQRQPPQFQTQPPPLMAASGASQGSNLANSISRAGSDRGDRSTRGSGAPSSDAGRTEDGSETGTVSSGRRLGRRANFFARLRNLES